MGVDNLGNWFSPYLSSCSRPWRRGLSQGIVVVACYHRTTPYHLQVTYSQTLGVIGYSLLPLFVMAPIISILHSYPWVAFLAKVIHEHMHNVHQYHQLLLYLYVDSSSSLVGIQCWVSTGSRRAQTQKTSLTLPGFFALRLLSVPVHRSMTQLLTTRVYTLNILTQSSFHLNEYICIQKV